MYESLGKSQHSPSLFFVFSSVEAMHSKKPPMMNDKRNLWIFTSFIILTEDNLDGVFKMLKKSPRMKSRDLSKSRFCQIDGSSKTLLKLVQHDIFFFGQRILESFDQMLTLFDLQE